MAKPVKLKQGREFAFRSAAGTGAVSKYPWDEWFSGDLLMLEKDVTASDGKIHKRDFGVDIDTMPPKIKTAARRRYKVVQISRLDADGNKLVESLIIRARDMTAEERQAEDLKRAEEKAAKQEEKQSAATTGTPDRATQTQGEEAA